jgi:hypothetical protein
MPLLVLYLRVYQDKITKPGQTQDADGGHRPTKNGGGHSPGQAVISCTDDSLVGSIHVIASIKVVETAFDIDDPDAPPFIEVELSAEPENTEDQPDIWRVVYGHYDPTIALVVAWCFRKLCDLAVTLEEYNEWDARGFPFAALDLTRDDGLRKVAQGLAPDAVDRMAQLFSHWE